MKVGRWMWWPSAILVCALLIVHLFTPTHKVVPIPVVPQEKGMSEEQVASLQVAMVFGRAQGCEDASPELIQLTAQKAREAKLDPRLAAATIAVESACNSFAVSAKGAIGLMQIMPKVWNDKYDFTGSTNLLNRKDNIRVGTQILGDLVRQFGVSEGVRRYQGTGVTCPTCDTTYTSKILTLARVDGMR